MDADERRIRLGILAMTAAAGLAFATGILPGALAVASGIIGGIALIVGLAAAYAPELGIAEQRPAPRPPAPAREPPAPQQAIYLTTKADTPPAVRRWLERVEAEAEAERSR